MRQVHGAKFKVLSGQPGEVTSLAQGPEQSLEGQVSGCLCCSSGKEQEQEQG